ncbi:translation initiation factor eIF3 subunit-domain-containing protein [Pilobolus umbonatus]|nr:translation initiation factor eIF3 subunit-domain-containing protein [Pilobolus umbonatus]
MRTSIEISPYSIHKELMTPMDNTPRFSVNSNLMNYSIPKNNEEITIHVPVSHIEDTTLAKRKIQKGDTDTRSKQLEAQIEQLTLQNVKLQRTNRLLKVDTDNLIEQKTRPLEKNIQDLTISNVRLQRASRLLQLELEDKIAELNRVKNNQILQMKSVGPEYEFLVQYVNLLQRQISGHPTCDETCCFTMKPIDQSTMVMTLPAPENEDEEEVEAQHICRPVIHSEISQGSYAIELENRIARLGNIIDEIDAEKEQLIHQQTYKDNDVETLKKELRLKDEIVSQLEQDFMGLEDQIEHLQKELQDQTMFSNNSNSFNRLLTPPPIQTDPRRQSQMLMESKRRSFAIKDTDLLEQMLRGDLENFEQGRYPSEEDMGESDEDIIEETIVDSPIEEKPVMDVFLSSTFPCHYTCMEVSTTHHDPFTIFTAITILLGFSSLLGITDDWTVPITLATLVSTIFSKPKMSWDDEDSDDNNDNVKESWDSDDEVPVVTNTPEKKTEGTQVKKALTLKQKIAEKEEALKEQKKKKVELANRFLDGETEEEKVERLQKEAGIKKGEFIQPGEETAKKAPTKPVESIKPRTRADFEEFKKLLIDMILEHASHPSYATFIEQLASDLAQPMKDMDVRKAASSLTALANDKKRQQKEALKTSKKGKGKNQATKAVPAVPVSTREYSTTYDDFDDFM